MELEDEHQKGVKLLIIPNIKEGKLTELKKLIIIVLILIKERKLLYQKII